MKAILSSKETKFIELECMKKISESELIERASLALFSEVSSFNCYKIFVGSGNNGSDGLSLAIRLVHANKKVIIYYLGEGKSKENIALRDRVRALKIPNKFIKNVSCIEISENDCIIDAMLGIGITRELDGLYLDVAKTINESKAFVFAIDIPSGLNSDNGFGYAVNADVTITFSTYKYGHFLGNGKNFCGKIIVKDIGINNIIDCAWVLEESDCEFPKRKLATHKGNYPNIKIIAGSPTMIGASLLAHESALSSLRVGAGYATLVVPKSLAVVYQTRVKEEMLFFVSDNDGKIVVKEEEFSKVLNATAIVIGPGLSANLEIKKIIKYLSDNYLGILIIDADGLNELSKDLTVLNGHKCDVILTPHIGEFRRLIGKNDYTVSEVKEFAESLNCTIVLKGAASLITNGMETYVNVSGTPAMAKGGSGDVLSGIIGALANKDNITLSSAKACYIFGCAGEKAASRYGEYSVLASDIIGVIREEINGKI